MTTTGAPTTGTTTTTTTTVATTDWYWEDEDGSWFPFSNDNIRILEWQYSSGSDTAFVLKEEEDNNVTMYNVDLINFLQTDLTTSFTSRICRGFPSNNIRFSAPQQQQQQQQQLRYNPQQVSIGDGGAGGGGEQRQQQEEKEEDAAVLGDPILLMLQEQEHVQVQHEDRRDEQMRDQQQDQWEPEQWEPEQQQQSQPQQLELEQREREREREQQQQQEQQYQQMETTTTMPTSTDFFPNTRDLLYFSSEQEQEQEQRELQASLPAMEGGGVGHGTDIDIDQQISSDTGNDIDQQISSGYQQQNDKKNDQDDNKDDEREMEENAPQSFLCPLTFGIMKDPVITSAGSTYERMAIEKWIKKSPKDPLTNRIIRGRRRKTADFLVPNRILKDTIEEWKKKYREGRLCGVKKEGAANNSKGGNATRGDTTTATSNTEQTVGLVDDEAPLSSGSDDIHHSRNGSNNDDNNNDSNNGILPSPIPLPLRDSNGQCIELREGEEVRVPSSRRSSFPHTIKFLRGIYSCSCPCWRFAGGPIDRRTCKHLRSFRGDEAENRRLFGGENATKRLRLMMGSAVPSSSSSSSSSLSSSSVPLLPPSPLRGKTICFLGSLSIVRRDAQSQALAAGASCVTKSVTRATDIVVAGPGAGTKLYNAQAEGKEIWDEEEFMDAVRGIICDNDGGGGGNGSGGGGGGNNDNGTGSTTAADATAADATAADTTTADATAADATAADTTTADATDINATPTTTATMVTYTAVPETTHDTGGTTLMAMLDISPLLRGRNDPH